MGVVVGNVSLRVVVSWLARALWFRWHNGSRWVGGHRWPVVWFFLRNLARVSTPGACAAVTGEETAARRRLWLRLADIVHRTAGDFVFAGLAAASHDCP